MNSIKKSSWPMRFKAWLVKKLKKKQKKIFSLVLNELKLWASGLPEKI